MDLSRKWLTDFVDVTDIPDKEFCDRMTDTGSKVEGYTVLGAARRARRMSAEMQVQVRVKAVGAGNFSGFPWGRAVRDAGVPRRFPGGKTS